MDKDLDQLRIEIDSIDRKILEAFEERIAVSRKIGNTKKNIGKAVLDQGREALKLEDLERLAGFESRQYVRDLYEVIFRTSREHQLKESFGVLGRSLPHTYSPEIHSMMAPEYSYSIIEREPEELDELFASKVYKGFNVTIPYKIEAYKRCDVLDDAAKDIGSVNTVVFRDGKTYGYNTDCYGFMYMMRKAGIDPEGKKVLVLGTGGAAAAINYALKVTGAGLIRSCGRSSEINYGNVYDLAGDSEIIVNCTPAGMYPKVEESLIDLGRFKALEACLDVVYNPSRTMFLQQAEERGLKTAGGLSMLVAQAYKASRYFIGDLEAAEKIDADAEVLIEKVTDMLQAKMRNITIIGMPGSGKTNLGKYIAYLTGRKFVDLDFAYADRFGETPADTIKRDGEDKFRLNETEVAKEFLPQSGLVISCGGGIVTQERNIPYLRYNSNVIYLKRPLEMLAGGAGRPITARDGVEKLYEQRKDKYEKTSDYEVSIPEFDDKTDFMFEAVEDLRKAGLHI